MRYRAWLISATLLQGIFATEADPLSNLRPENITGLIYYLYRWTGSYFNGTTTIKLQPQDYIEDSDCDTFAPGPIVVSYENSLLALTQTNGYLTRGNPSSANPLAFSLKFWTAGLNLLPSGNMDDGPVKEIQEISSVSMNTKDVPDNPTAPPFWSIATSHDSEVSYSFTGHHNSSRSQQLRFNYTHCTLPSLATYLGTLLDPNSPLDPSNSNYTLQVTSSPRVSALFNNESSTLEIRGVFQGTAEDGGSFLGGNISITFNGKIDEARSDKLLPNSHDGPPIWEQTLGYTKTLTGEKPQVQQGSAPSLKAAYFYTVALMILYVMHVL